MTPFAPIAAVGATPAPLNLALGALPPVAAQPTAVAATPGFGDMLMNGLRGVDTRVAEANKLVNDFALDDSVPVHHVTMALEQARLSVELAMQVRQRLVEGYRELMNMQL